MNIKLITMKALIMLLVAFLSAHLHASSDEQSTNEFFSLAEIKNAPKKSLQPIDHVQASDDVSLAYRAYLPKQAQAILIFYHGAGAHSGLSYNHIGADLRDNFNIAVYMPDIRGHGGSGGNRGDTPQVEKVWLDINTMVNVARDKYPNLPLFVGGHSSGAGLALNYSSWDQRAEIDGYVFLAPYFGYRSETNYDTGENKRFEFSIVKTSDFVINSMSGGLFSGHSKAVKFNFPDSVLRDNPEIVPFNTVNMSNAVTPHSPDTQLSDIQQFGLWIGMQDEAFDPLKVTMFAQKYSGKEASKEIEIVDKENHFSIILNAASFVGPWINHAIK
ncbi:alpha/beta hydrolase [Shewanella glacialimarina]|uniref:alpha/beta hydrolase n=1 Tax=Shewanella glacialimarina TaxID=2590884 RepID=UPI001CF8A1B8|nr:alpha/beta hydrolase [Shewanella glacialimarina]UCX05744.1 alpha/beta fold hydrolase [Shewanella glacialimarina]